MHAEYPDDWTIDKLASSFPISKEGLLRFLRSHYVPKSQEEVNKHDKKVQKRWLALVDGIGDDPGGPIANRYRDLLKSGKLELLKHADGIKSLPMPENKTARGVVVISESNSVGKLGSSNRKGPFSSIYQAYADSKNKTAVPNSEVTDNMDNDNNLSSEKLLKSIISLKQLRSKQKESDLQLPGKDSSYSQNIDSRKHIYEKQILENMVNVGNERFEMKSMYDVYAGPEVDDDQDMSEEENLKGRRFRRRRRRVSVKTIETQKEDFSESKLTDEEIPELKGTGRIENLNDMSQFVGMMDSTESTGYQKKFDPPVDSIHIPKEKFKPGAIYQRGDCFYDENGQFLYRLS